MYIVILQYHGQDMRGDIRKTRNNVWAIKDEKSQVIDKRQEIRGE